MLIHQGNHPEQFAQLFWPLRQSGYEPAAAFRIAKLKLIAFHEGRGTIEDCIVEHDLARALLAKFHLELPATEALAAASHGIAELVSRLRAETDTLPKLTMVTGGNEVVASTDESGSEESHSAVEPLRVASGI